MIVRSDPTNKRWHSLAQFKTVVSNHVYHAISHKTMNCAIANLPTTVIDYRYAVTDLMINLAKEDMP